MFCFSIGCCSGNDRECLQIGFPRSRLERSAVEKHEARDRWKTDPRRFPGIASGGNGRVSVVASQAVISGTFRVRNDAEQLVWTGSAIVGGIVIGLATEWIHPWSSVEPAIFLGLVDAIWPAGITVDRTRIVPFFNGLICSIAFMTKLTNYEPSLQHLKSVHWKLVSELETTRSYRRRNQLLRVSLDTADQSCQLAFPVAKINPISSSLRCRRFPADCSNRIKVRFVSTVCFARRIRCLRRYFVPDTPMVYSTLSTWS